MDHNIEIPQSKQKIVLLLLISLAFVASSIWIAMRPEVFIENILEVNNLRIIRIVGVSGIIFFGITRIYGIRKLFDKRSELIIDSNGITDHSNVTSIGLIEWKDISNIRSKKVLSTHYLLIDVTNPVKHITMSKNSVRSKLMRANFKKFGTPISISSDTLKYNFIALEKLMQEQFKRHKSAT